MSDTPASTTLLETLKALVAKVEGDYAKAREGNQAAGTRVRSGMQEIRNTAKSVREEMLAFRGKARQAKASKQK